jgi:hypothetical protein
MCSMGYMCSFRICPTVERIDRSKVCILVSERLRVLILVALLNLDGFIVG